MKRITIFIVACATLVTAIGAVAAHASAKGEIAGQVVAQKDGKQIVLPLLSSDYKIEIEGTVATVQITQSFSNPGATALHAQYLFPLNQHAAVFAMKMVIGDEVIEAVIKEKEDAQRTFDAAKSEGKVASLLTQHRPNMFMQDIANLMPGLPVKVTLSYVQSIQKLDSNYSLVVPMIVAPRFGQIAHAQAGVKSAWQIGDLPSYPDVAGFNLPKDQVKPRVTLAVNLRAGLPVSGFGSPTHALHITGDDRIKSAKFSDGQAPDNRDLILTYALEGDSLQAGVLGYFGANRGYASIVVEPPKIIPSAMVTPRELIFLVDTSGSQEGQPLEASKTFMKVALDALRPDDYFRIIEFENNVTPFAQDAKLASAAHIKAGQRFVRDLNTGGGTNIDGAIQAAFSQDPVPGTLRIVVFLSDGLVGDEASVIGRIRQDIGDTRIYSFGVGTAVNRYLMDGVAKAGRGYARYIDPSDAVSEVAARFAQALKTPVLTDIEIDWGGLDVSDVGPTDIPDLFEGGSTRIFLRYETGGEHQIKIKGRVNGVPAELPLDIILPSVQTENASNALPLIWARNQIAAKTLDFNTGMGPKGQLEAEIIDLGLKHSLQSQFTSFVAVSSVIYNDAADATQTKSVALPSVAATSANAYPSAITGSSTPEPETLLGLLLALCLGVSKYWRHLITCVAKWRTGLRGQA